MEEWTVNELKWTKEAPTKPGWYWFRSPDLSKKYCVCASNDSGRMYIDFPWGWRRTDRLDERYEFAGPIPSPTEPQEAEHKEFTAYISHKTEACGMPHKATIHRYIFVRGEREEFLPPGRYRLIPLEAE